MTQQVLIRLHFVLKYIVYRLDTGRSRVAPYPLGIFFCALFLCDLSSWTSDLFHLLAHCLVSQKVKVSSTGSPSNKENTACTKYFLLKLSMTVETDHLPSSVVHAKWICSGGSEVMSLHVTFLVPFPG